MSDELKGRGMTGLRHVPDDEIRDGSKPLTQPVSVTEQVDADWKDDAHVPEKVPELAHLNHPKNGETIDQRFNLHFIDPRACDKKIRLVFRPEEKSTEESAELKTLELETFGNQIKKKIERPQGLAPGAYSE